MTQRLFISILIFKSRCMYGSYDAALTHSCKERQHEDLMNHRWYTCTISKLKTKIKGLNIVLVLNLWQLCQIGP